MNFNELGGRFKSFQEQNPKRHNYRLANDEASFSRKNSKQKLEAVWASTDELTRVIIEKQKKEMYLLWTSYFTEKVGKVIPGGFSPFIGHNILPELLKKLSLDENNSGLYEESFLKYLIDNQKKYTAYYWDLATASGVKFTINPGYVCCGLDNKTNKPLIIKTYDYVNKIAKNVIDSKYACLNFKLKNCVSESYKITSEETNLQKELTQRLSDIGFNSQKTLFRFIAYGFFKQKGWKIDTLANKEKLFGVDNIKRFLTDYIDLFIADFKTNYTSFFNKSDVERARLLAILNFRKRHEEDKTVSSQLILEKHKLFKENKDSENIFIFLKGNKESDDKAAFTVVDCFYAFHLPAKQEYRISFDRFLQTLKEGTVISIQAQSELDPLRGKFSQFQNGQILEKIKNTPIQEVSKSSILNTRKKILEFKKKWFGLPLD